MSRQLVGDEPVARARRLLRAIVWLAVAATAGIPLIAYFSTATPTAIVVAAAVLGLLAVWRTRDAVLLVAAFGPITPTLHALTRAPSDGQGLFELCVLVVLVGAAVRASLRAVPLQPTVFEAVVVAFILVVAASCLAHLPVLGLKADTGGAVATLEAFAFRDYFQRHPPFVPLERAALLIEGAALAALIGRLFRGAAEANRLSRMVVLGGAAAGALNLYRLLEVSLRQPPFLDGLRRAATGLRFHTQFGDVNAAGSYFAMVSVLALGRLRRHARAAVLNGAAVIAVVAGVWVSGSRVALAATLVCGTALLLTRRFGRVMSEAAVRRVRLSVGLMLVATFVVVVLVIPLTRHTSISYSVATRIELTKIGLRMVAARPWFGVGVAQYYEQFGQFVSPELEKMFLDALGKPVPRENAHNQFVQVGAELGLVGFTAFLLVLGAALGRSARPVDERRPAVIAAIAAFLLTCLAGHPLLTGVVTLSFFVVVGLAASGARSVATWRRPHAAALAGLVLLLSVTLPARAQLERHEADLTGVTSGLSIGQHDSGGIRFQWAGERATLFVPSRLTAVRIPLQAPGAVPRRVQILLDGRIAAGILVPPGRWLDVNLPLPDTRDEPRFRRIDLVVEREPGGMADAGGQLLMVGRVGEFER